MQPQNTVGIDYLSETYFNVVVEYEWVITFQIKLYMKLLIRTFI